MQKSKRPHPYRAVVRLPLAADPAPSRRRFLRLATALVASASGCATEPRVHRRLLAPPPRPAVIPTAWRNRATVESAHGHASPPISPSLVELCCQSAIGRPDHAILVSGQQPGEATADAPVVTNEQHDAALMGLFRELGAVPGRSLRSDDPRLLAAGIEIVGDPLWRGLDWDELWVASDFSASHVRDPNASPGIGVPLIVYRGPNRRDVLPDRFYPELWKFPATAVMELPPPESPARLRIRLIDPVANALVSDGTIMRPLATDVANPVVHQLAHSGYRLESWRGLARPETMTDERGVMTLLPYRPGRIPIVLIHGMACSPRIMSSLANSILADPELRDRYQVWFAYYTSGDTILQTAAVLRRSLRELREYYDPGRSDPAWDRIVVLGHSLGSPIARLLTTWSDRTLESTILTRPLDSLRMSADSRQRAEEALFFEPVPEIRRVIHLAGTIRGSQLASQLEGRLLTTVLPRRPGLKQFHEEVIAWNGADALRPPYQKAPPTSVDNQRPDSPILNATNALRQNALVRNHTIQANATPWRPVENSTDLLVPFWSSRLEDAESQLVVGANHFCTHNPEVLAEVRRILRRHLVAG